MLCRALPWGLTLLKLYKKEGDRLRYWEAWVHEGVLTTHWGFVGEVGEQKDVPLPPEEDPDFAIADVAGPLIEEGYDEVEPDSLSTLIVQYPIEGKGTGHDVEKRVAVEELLTDALGWTGNGEVEGGELREGHLRVYCLVMDEKAGVYTVLEALDSEDLADDVSVLVARGDEEPRVAWPQTP